MLVLRYQRQKRGWTQKTLADLARTYQPIISDIERSRRRPTDQLLDRIAGALGVSPAFNLLRPVAVDETRLEGRDPKVPA